MGDLDGRRLLVLGAGRHQVPLIRRAVARGAEVVTSDYLPDAPGRQFATVPVLGDAIDVATNLRIAREHDVDAITTIGTDQAMVAVATVAEELGLPCHVSADAARRATHKVPMRAALRAAGVPVPATLTVHGPADLERLDIPGPWVVKPADAQGQRATVRVSVEDDLGPAVAAAVAASRTGTAVVEQFVQGPEATATAWLADGEVHLVGVADRLTYNPPPSLGIALRHTSPSRNAADRLDRVGDVVARVAAAYEMTEGPLYVQFLCTPDGEVVVMEAAARVGGGHEPQLYAPTTPFDLVDLSIDLALDGTTDAPDFDVRRDDPRAGAITFIVARAGRFATQQGLADLIAAGGVDEGSWYHPDGHDQTRVTDGQGRIGWFLVTDDDVDTVQQRSTAAYAALSVRDDDGRELVYWPREELLLS